MEYQRNYNREDNSRGQNNYLDGMLSSSDGLISEDESILERSIRGNINQLLQSSMDSQSISMMNQTEGFDKNSAPNKLPLPKPINSNIKINEDFLRQFSNPRVFQIYRVKLVNILTFIVTRRFQSRGKKTFKCVKEFYFCWLKGNGKLDLWLQGKRSKSFWLYSKQLFRILERDEKKLTLS